MFISSYRHRVARSSVNQILVAFAEYTRGDIWESDIDDFLAVLTDWDGLIELDLTVSFAIRKELNNLGWIPSKHEKELRTHAERVLRLLKATYFTN